jgi:hypothetical protein
MSEKSKKIDSKLRVRSFAQLGKEVEEILKNDHEEKPIASLIDENEFCGWSPPHEINGVPYEELMERRKQLEDENS